MANDVAKQTISELQALFNNLEVLVSIQYRESETPLVYKSEIRDSQGTVTQTGDPDQWQHGKTEKRTAFFDTFKKILDAAAKLTKIDLNGAIRTALIETSKPINAMAIALMSMPTGGIAKIDAGDIKKSIDVIKSIFAMASKLSPDTNDTLADVEDVIVKVADVVTSASGDIRDGQRLLWKLDLQIKGLLEGFPQPAPKP